MLIRPQPELLAVRGRRKRSDKQAAAADHGGLSPTADAANPVARLHPLTAADGASRRWNFNGLSARSTALLAQLAPALGRCRRRGRFDPGGSRFPHIARGSTRDEYVRRA